MASGPRAGRRDFAGRERAPGLDPTARRERLRAVVEPVVAKAGYDLEDLTVARAGRRHLVRVVVDADGGVSLDAIAEVARAVSAALDAAEEAGDELFAGEYSLEVGSPGVDRPLTEPRHWRRNVGRLVKVQARVEPSADRQLTARVAAADDDGVVLTDERETYELAYAQLGPGRVQVEFTRLADVADEDLDEVPGPQDEDDDEELEDEER